MVDDNDNRDNSDKEKENVNYVRKRNLIPGIDNDHLIIGGLGVLAAIGLAPYAKQLAENFLRNLPQNQGQGQQLPPNGMQQQPVYYPPAPTPQSIPSDITREHVHEHQHEVSPLAEHEQGMRDQKAYEAAQEKEAVQSPVSFSMVPDRSTQVSQNKNKNRGNYEAGSNISGSYS